MKGKKAFFLKNVDQEYRNLNSKQRVAADAIVKNWFDSGTDKFVFPVVDGPPGTGKTHVATIACAKYLLQCIEEKERGEVVYLCKTNVACQRAKKKFIEDLGFDFCPPGRLPPFDKLLVVQVIAGEGPLWQDGVVYWNSCTLPDVDRIRIHNVLVITIDSSHRANDLRKEPKIVLDEFSQINPLDFFAAIERICRKDVKPRSFALLGDPIQLPVVTTQPYLRPNIFSTISGLKPGFPHHKLETQYRMHEHICEVVNEIRQRHYHTYPLKSDNSVKYRTLDADLFGYDFKQSSSSLFEKVLDPNLPVVLLDTSLLGDEEQALSGSWLNQGEAELTARIAQQFARGFKSPATAIKILTPYAAQRELISQLIANKLSKELSSIVDTIYSAQGQEWPCVIISFVRNNNTRNWGFLGDHGELDLAAQIYVGVSRAMAKLVVLAAYERTFKGHPDFDSIWESPHAEKISSNEVKRWSSI